MSDPGQGVCCASDPAAAASDNPGLRRSVYALLICLSAGLMLGRILAVDSVDELKLEDYRVRRELEKKEKLFAEQGLKDDDLAEALAAEKSRLEERLQLRRPFLSANDRSRWCTLRALVEEDLRVPGRPYAIDRVIALPRWDTIDMVKYDGHLYSSKPPLFPTLLAGEYWLIYKITGQTLGTAPYEIGRFMLITVNLAPLLIYFVLIARLAERLGTTDWGRIFVVAAASLATFLSTFVVVINNHLPGAVCAAITFYAAVRIWFDGRRELRYFAVAGLFGALMVTCELPALALLALLGAALLWKAPRPTLLAGVPAALLVMVAYFGTNWIAFQSLKPAYARKELYDYTYERNGRTYESYWNNPVGIDRGEPSYGRYAFQSLIGHHGIFSLTPVWLLSVAGSLMWLGRRDDPRLRQLSLAVLLPTAACVVFYLFLQDQAHRNYGGMSSGLRWVFWLAPLWLVAMIPAADWVARCRWRRAAALLLLVVSVLSVSYPTWNPWTFPWLFDYFSSLGLIPPY